MIPFPVARNWPAPLRAAPVTFTEDHAFPSALVAIFTAPPIMATKLLPVYKTSFTIGFGHETDVGAFQLDPSADQLKLDPLPEAPPFPEATQIPCP